MLTKDNGQCPRGEVCRWLCSGQFIDRKQQGSAQELLFGIGERIFLALIQITLKSFPIRFLFSFAQNGLTWRDGEGTDNLFTIRLGLLLLAWDNNNGGILHVGFYHFVGGHGLYAGPGRCECGGRDRGCKQFATHL